MAEPDDWGEPPTVFGSPTLHLSGFDGPMDVLLDLAERQRIDLGRMSVLALAEQFVAAMERLAAHVPLERRADWLVMATRLVLLRSRLLFPASPEAAAEAARDAAAALHQIESLSEARAAASWLQRRPQLGLEVFSHPQPQRPRESGYVALMEACLVLLEGRDAQPWEAPLYEPMPDLWRATDALARIRSLLLVHSEGGALDLFLPALSPDDIDREMKARGAVSSTFLAGLELAKEGEIDLQQDEPCGRVFLRPFDVEKIVS
ncbi:segregation and condensation protein A [Acidisoma sp.]|uniref:segregation and condensation protein A n=1 Tax=Acidisoma sp. TaxID=1872115 RepID=UPI003B000F72